MRQSHQNSSGDAIRWGGGYKVEQQRSVCVFLLAHHIPHSQLAQEEVGGWASYDGEFRMPLVLAQASPIFHSSCEGKLGIALE